MHFLAQWIPCLVMLFAYYRIFLEANRQEKMLYKSQMIIPQHHHRNRKKQAKPAANNRPPEPVQPAPLAPASQPNNNSQKTNLNTNDEDGAAVPPASVEPKNSIPELTNGSTVGHNGARLSNTSTTTTVTTLSTSTTTTATSGPATTSSSGAQQQTTAAQLENAGKEETSLTRRKSSITASMSAAVLPNSQSTELKNSQINLAVQEKATPPQKPTSIDIQPANTAPISSTAHRNSHGDDTESGQSTPTKRNINKMRREHKAAKTLGRLRSSY